MFLPPYVVAVAVPYDDDDSVPADATRRLWLLRCGDDAVARSAVAACQAELALADAYGDCTVSRLRLPERFHDVQALPECLTLDAVRAQLRFQMAQCEDRGLVTAGGGYWDAFGLAGNGAAMLRHSAINRLNLDDVDSPEELADALAAACAKQATPPAPAVVAKLVCWALGGDPAAVRAATPAVAPPTLIVDELAQLEDQLATLTRLMDALGAEEDGDPLQQKIDRICCELGPRKYAATPTRELLQLQRDRQAAYNALGWSESGAALRAEVRMLAVAVDARTATRP